MEEIPTAPAVAPQENLEDIPDPETDIVFKIVLLRSGESEFENTDTYIGWYDSKLTEYGRKQIKKSAELLKSDNYTFDLAYCSTTSRSKESLMIILDHLELEDIEIQNCWQLNDRHCGGLTGYSQDELAAKYGQEQVRFWMNSIKIPPPSMAEDHKFYNAIYSNAYHPKDVTLPVTESLQMCQNRVIGFWKKNICPNILSGRKILIVTHSGCIQALVQYLDGIEYNDFMDKKIPSATPFYYKLDETLRPILKDSYTEFQK